MEFESSMHSICKNLSQLLSRTSQEFDEGGPAAFVY